VASNATDGCARLQSRTCNCNLRPADRTAIGNEQRISESPQPIALTSSAPLFAVASSSIYIAVTASANLPPPVPHRVLHCSWII
jgi:hypothetical protein